MEKHDKPLRRPAAQSASKAIWLPQIDPALCNGCGLCVDVCPNDALGWVGDVAALTAPERCNYCASCESICPTAAIELPYLVCKQLMS